MWVQTEYISRYLSCVTREVIRTKQLQRRDETNTKETLRAQYAGANWACEFQQESSQSAAY